MNRFAADLDRACSILGVTLPPVRLPASSAPEPYVPTPFVNASGRRVSSNAWARLVMAESEK